jgi:hypothetical protein
LSDITPKVKPTSMVLPNLMLINGRQTYPYEDRAEAAAQLRLAKLKQRGAKDKGKFRDKAFENALKATDRI